MTIDCGLRGLRRALAPAGALVAYAPLACASYAQMTLPGLGATILLALLVVYALVVDLVLLLKGFRFRALVIVNTIIVLAWATGLAVGRADLAALFENIAWEWQATLLGVARVVPIVVVIRCSSARGCGVDLRAALYTQPSRSSACWPRRGWRATTSGTIRRRGRSPNGRACAPAARRSSAAA
jgi:hypothetical protein